MTPLKENSEYIDSKRKQGKEYVLLGELPHPNLAAYNDHVLAVEGIKVYLRLPREAWES